MYASIWTFRGDPDELLRSFDAMLSEIPRANLQLHLCLRAPKGIVLIDTPPTKENFEAFARGDTFRLLRARRGLPEPERIEEFPVYLAFVGGQERARAELPHRFLSSRSSPGCAAGVTITPT